MKVLLAGGVFRKSAEQLKSQQPTPEMVLTEGLRSRGIHVTTCPLEDISAIAASRGYDIVHVHHLSKASVVAGALSNSSRFVFTRHGTEPLTQLRNRVGLRAVMRRMSAGICLSESEKHRVLNDFPGVADKLHVIPNGLHLKQYGKKPPSSPSSVIKCLFVGQLIPLKRVDSILDAVSADKRFTLRIVYHNDRLEQSLRAQARRLNIEDRVVFVGQRSGDDLFREYISADVLLLPSESEALPSVVTEALSVGLPIVASDCGGVKDQVGDAGLLFDPNNPNGLSHCLDILADNLSYFHMRASARSRDIKSTYSVDRMIASHVRLYEELLS